MPARASLCCRSLPAQWCFGGAQHYLDWGGLGSTGGWEGPGAAAPPLTVGAPWKPFALCNHSWKSPIQRVQVVAAQTNAVVALGVVGGTLQSPVGSGVPARREALPEPRVFGPPSPLCWWVKPRGVGWPGGQVCPRQQAGGAPGPRCRRAGPCAPADPEWGARGPAEREHRPVRPRVSPAPPGPVTPRMGVSQPRLAPCREPFPGTPPAGRPLKFGQECSGAAGGAPETELCPHPFPLPG